MDKFQGKYRIKSTRLPGWDYGSPGYYFVTICTRDRIPFFGDVTAGKMRLSPIGEIAAEEWAKTGEIRPNVVIDEWVVMPNHMHGIIVIVDTPRRGPSTGNPHWKPNTLGAIINQYKSKCTKRIRAAGYVDFGWQRRFYDHIIRDERALHGIRRYIADNPRKWGRDRNRTPGR